MNPANEEVFLYTDGACSGNPGPGGWAYVMRHIKTGKEKEASGGAEDTTNNRMELSAVIEGLATLTRPTSVRVVTDSTYVMKGVTEWMKNWKRNGWRRKTRGGFEPVKNDELWKRLDELCQAHQVTWEHVKGHSGHPENERCDVLAVEAYQKYLRR
ncbi:MAG: ribonuclease HI [Candidatus Hinthialibacter antarcticus]|nr:ribonuclease HI [Candidatus Hinthialibacter antarcticus]